MKPMVFLICLLFLLTCSTAYGGDSLTKGLSGIAGGIQKELAPIGKIPNTVVERFNGAANTVTGMVNGAAAYVFPPAAAKNTPERPVVGLSLIQFVTPTEVAVGQYMGGVYKNGSVILSRVDEWGWAGNPIKTTVTKGTLKGDIITMDNGDRGMLNKSAQVVVIGSTTYYKN